jgi:hypothetical protein
MVDVSLQYCRTNVSGALSDVADRAAPPCGAAACFGRATDLGAVKRVRFENKKITVLGLDFFKKR